MKRPIVLASFLLFGWFRMPLGADVVPISISQQVSVSGYATACDFGCGLSYGVQDSGQYFSLAAGNTDLPPTNLDQSGGATDTVPIFSDYTRTATVTADASQSSTVTAGNIQFDLDVASDFSGSDSLMSGSTSTTSQYTLVFNLTTASLVTLTGGTYRYVNQGQFGSLDGTFDGEIHLTGPGFQFDQVDSLDINDSSFLPPIEEVFALAPGQYTLNAVDTENVDQNYYLATTLGSEVYLNADFTAITPEPAWISGLLGLLMAVGIFCTRRN